MDEWISTKEAEKRYGLSQKQWTQLAPLLSGKKEHGRWYILTTKAQEYIDNLPRVQGEKIEKRESIDTETVLYYALTAIFLIVIVGRIAPEGIKTFIKILERRLYLLATFRLSVGGWFASSLVVVVINLIAGLTKSVSGKQFWGKLKFWIAYPVMIVSSFLGPLTLLLIFISGVNSQFIDGNLVILGLLMFHTFTIYGLVAITVWNPNLYFDYRPSLFYDVSDLLANLVVLVWVLSGDNILGFPLFTRVFFVLMFAWEIYLMVDDLKERDWRFRRVVGSVMDISGLEVTLTQKTSALRKAIDKFNSMSDLERQQLAEYIGENRHISNWKKASSIAKVVIVAFIVALLIESPAQELFRIILQYFGY